MYKCNLGYQGGTVTSYFCESEEDFESRCYRIAMFALPGTLKIEKV